MLAHRKRARDAIKKASQTEYREMVLEARLTEDMQKILHMKFIKGYSIVKIAAEINYSMEFVYRNLEAAYDKVAHILKD